MSQYNFGNLESPLSGTTFFNTHLEPWRNALHSTHSGSSAPSYVTAGMIWLDTTTNPWLLKIYDGNDHITLGKVNTADNTFTPTGAAQWGGSAGGTANALTLTPSPAMEAWTTGNAYDFLITAANTTEAPTINISGKGAKTVKWSAGAGKVNLPIGAFQSGMIARGVYDGTDFVVIGIRPYNISASIATASTVNLNNASGDYVHLTGTTTVTAITLLEGLQRTCVCDGAFTLTDGSGNSPQGIICPGGANITTAAGDVFTVRGEASGAVRVTSYTKANGQPLVSTGSQHGQCYLSKSSTNLLLAPENGNKIIINGVSCTIPDAGVTLAPTSLSSNTTYYIYALDSNGDGTVDALEASATGYAVQAGSGVVIKSGDATRTLVGMARTDGSTAWQDSGSKRFVVSFFNRKTKVAASAFSTARTVTTTSLSEVNSEIRNEFITWPDEICDASIMGESNGAASGLIYKTAMAVDSTTAGYDSIFAQDSANGGDTGISINRKLALSIGYHYITLLGSTGNASYGNVYTGSASAGNRTIIETVIRG